MIVEIFGTHDAFQVCLTEGKHRRIQAAVYQHDGTGDDGLKKGWRLKHGGTDVYLGRFALPWWEALHRGLVRLGVSCRLMPETQLWRV